MFFFSSLGLPHTCQTDNELVSRCCREQTYCVQPSTTTTTITLTGLMPLSSQQILRKLIWIFSTSYVLKKKKILNLFFWIVGARKGLNVQVFVPLWSQHSKLELLKLHRNNPLMLQIVFFIHGTKKKKDHMKRQEIQLFISSFETLHLSRWLWCLNFSSCLFWLQRTEFPFGTSSSFPYSWRNAHFSHYI